MSAAKRKTQSLGIKAFLATIRRRSVCPCIIAWGCIHAPRGSDAEIVSQPRSLLSLRRYSHVSGLESYAAPDKGSVGTTLDCIAECVFFGNPIRNYSAEGLLTLSCFPSLPALLPFLLAPVHLLFGGEHGAEQMVHLLEGCAFTRGDERMRAG